MATERIFTAADIDRLGPEIFQTRIRPILTKADTGKAVVIDARSGE